MAKFIKQDRLKPENVEIGKSIEVHADVLATFKTYVSRYNKDKTEKMRFEYSGFSGAFCTATRKSNELIKPLTP